MPLVPPLRTALEEIRRATARPASGLPGLRLPPAEKLRSSLAALLRLSRNYSGGRDEVAPRNPDTRPSDTPMELVQEIARGLNHHSLPVTLPFSALRLKSRGLVLKLGIFDRSYLVRPGYIYSAILDCVCRSRNSRSRPGIVYRVGLRGSCFRPRDQNVVRILTWSITNNNGYWHSLPNTSINALHSIRHVGILFSNIGGPGDLT